MSTVKSFSVGSMTVNAAMPSALEQDEVLSLIGAQVISRAVNAATVGHTVGVDSLTNMFVCMPSEIKHRVATILLGKVMTHGTGTAITIADFQGKLIEYNKLLAELTLWNYGDFFAWLSRDVNVEAPGQPETAQ